MAISKVEDIPLPWKHEWGLTVVALEYPEDRPNVVDLRFEDGTRTAETKGARYISGDDGLWGLI